MEETTLDLFALEDSLELEPLAEGVALSCVACATSASTASCPATSASSVSSASSYT